MQVLIYMRIFVGIKASKNLETQIKKWQTDNSDLPVRFIKPENLHITLIPPWYEDNPDKWVSKMKSLKLKSFKISFDKIYINLKNKLIWIEASQPPAEIIVIQNKLLKIFAKEPEKRKFKCHITIARFKKAELLKNNKLAEINWAETADNVTLFVSKLSPRGANYTKICSTNLYP